MLSTAIRLGVGRFCAFLCNIPKPDGVRRDVRRAKSSAAISCSTTTFGRADCLRALRALHHWHVREERALGGSACWLRSPCCYRRSCAACSAWPSDIYFPGSCSACSYWLAQCRPLTKTPVLRRARLELYVVVHIRVYPFVGVYTSVNLGVYPSVTTGVYPSANFRLPLPRSLRFDPAEGST